MISYTGIETISNMAEEARNPRRLIPRSMRFVVLAVLVIYSGLPSVALSAMPVTHGADGYSTQLATTYAADPILGIVRNMHLGVFQTAVQYYVGILAATILLIASNAGIIGVSRLTYSMGQYQQVPERIRQVSPRFRTPSTAIIVFGVIACLVMIPGKAKFLGTLYSFGAMLSFTIAHCSLVGLRWRLARNRMREIPGDVRVGEDEQWYRAPLNVRVRGVDFPVFAILGGLATFAAWITVMALNLATLVVGSAWLAIGLTTYVVYRRRKQLPLTKTTKIALPKMVGVSPVEYGSVLVAFEDNTYSQSAIATALKLASHKGGDVMVLVMVTVPQHLSIDAQLPEDEATAQEIVEAARQWAGRRQRIKGQIMKVRAGEAGSRIVEEALQRRADAIVMPMPYHRPAGKLLNKTLETVLGKRPSRVIIDSERALPFRGTQLAA
jgi:APA family basic amino acid/polyamine antiporter